MQKFVNNNSAKGDKCNTKRKCYYVFYYNVPFYCVNIQFTFIYPISYKINYPHPYSNGNVKRKESTKIFPV